MKNLKLSLAILLLSITSSSLFAVPNDLSILDAQSIEVQLKQLHKNPTFKDATESTEIKVNASHNVDLNIEQIANFQVLDTSEVTDIFNKGFSYEKIHNQGESISYKITYGQEVIDIPAHADNNPSKTSTKNGYDFSLPESYTVTLTPNAGSVDALVSLVDYSTVTVGDLATFIRSDALNSLMMEILQQTTGTHKVTGGETVNGNVLKLIEDDTAKFATGNTPFPYTDYTSLRATQNGTIVLYPSALGPKEFIIELEQEISLLVSIIVEINTELKTSEDTFNAWAN